MNIGITLSPNAYTPEAYAYKDYLSKLGYKIQLEYKLDPNNNINIYFMGIKPFWKIKEGKALEIHEYHSLSTGRHPKIKNFLKKTLNKKPSGRIFLNQSVYSGFNFKNDCPFIFRDMGVSKEFYQKPSNRPIYDIVYCGSISGRRGLIKTIKLLSKFHKVAVIGNTSNEEKKALNISNISLLGAMSHNDIPEVYRESRFGLNYTPDIYPLNIQTSTKTLEYLSSGLHVISNRYEWIESFSRNNNYIPIWLDNLSDKQIIANEQIIPSMKKYEWDNILKECDFENFIIKVQNA